MKLKKLLNYICGDFVVYSNKDKTTYDTNQATIRMVFPYLLKRKVYKVEPYLLDSSKLFISVK